MPILFSYTMTNNTNKKRVSLEVSRGLHEKIKTLAKEREETMVSLVISALHEFLETKHEIQLRTNSHSFNQYTFNQYRFN